MSQDFYFRERQTFHPWVFLVLLAGLAVSFLPALSQHPADRWFAAGISLTVFLVIALLLGIMETKVYRDRIVITFGFLHLIKFKFRLMDVMSVEAKQYSPLWDYGGWGIRGFGRKRALNMRGDRGAEVILAEPGKQGRSVLIGSQHAEELAAAINQAMADQHYGKKGM